MLCIKNNLTHGFRIGLATGLGAALADSLYGFLAGGGLASVSQFLLSQSSAIKIAGGVILLYLGLSEIKNAKKSRGVTVEIKANGFAKTMTTTFFIVLANPATILSFLGIFAAIGGGNSTISGIAIMIFGVFLGSFIWWLILSAITSSTRHKIPEKFMARIRVVSGLILLGYSAAAFAF